MALEYREDILLQAAIALENKARLIVFWTAARFTGFTLVGVTLPCIIIRMQWVHDLPAEVIGGICAFFALLIGIDVGRDRAFFLRLKAQQLMALIQIERNTRKSIAAVAS